jgi:signal transduction histidine kinase
MKRALPLITGLMTVVLIAVFLWVNGKRVLRNEELVFRSRIASTEIYLVGTMSPINVIHRHIKQTLDDMESGLISIDYPLEASFDGEHGIYFLEPEQGDWVILSPPGGPFDTGIGKEELMVLIQMEDIFISVLESLPDTAWVYYLSGSRFLFIAPVFQVISPENFEHLYSMQFWTSAAPEQNPNRGMIVTDVYEDLGGKGPMVTLSHPVFFRNRFIGVTCMDITLEQLDRALAIGVSDGSTYLVDESGLILQGSEATLSGDRLGPMVDAWEYQGGFVRIDGVFLSRRTLIPGQLRIIHEIGYGKVLFKAFLNEIPFIIILLAMNLLVALLSRVSASLKKVSDESAFSRRLLSIIGHDLQSPLSVVSQATDVMIQDGKLDALDLVRQSSESATTLLKDLSYWGKSRYNTLAIEPQLTSVSGLFQKVVNFVQPSTKLKNICISTDIGPEFALVDPEAVSSVIRNLLTNAVKFSPPDGEVKLESQAGQVGTVLLRVSDQGTGMTDQQIQAFSARDSLESHPGTQGEKGLGIGLSIVASLCDQAGWPIHLQSTLGQGTEFTITVPGPVTENE